jgi:hypothetical protein
MGQHDQIARRMEPAPGRIRTLVGEGGLRTVAGPATAVYAALRIAQRRGQEMVLVAPPMPGDRPGHVVVSVRFLPARRPSPARELVRVRRPVAVPSATAGGALAVSIVAGLVIVAAAAAWGLVLLAQAVAAHIEVVIVVAAVVVIVLVLIGRRGCEVIVTHRRR